MQDYIVRLKEIMNLNHLSNYKLAQMTGISQTTIANWLSRKTVPDKSKLELISMKLNCSPQYLLTGEGSMSISPKDDDENPNIREQDYFHLKILLHSTLLKRGITTDIISRKTGYSQEEIQKIANIEDKSISIEDIEKVLSFLLNPQTSATTYKPRIPLTAAAGSLSDAARGVTLEECEQMPVISQLPSYDFTMFIKGDSMSPKYESGDEIACRWIDQTRFIQWGKIHVLDTTQGIIVKKVYDDGDKIRCVSINPDYPAFSIPKEDIYSMSIVIGALCFSEM